MAQSAFCAAAAMVLAIAAPVPAAVAAGGVDEYSLNLPDGGNGQPSGDGVGNDGETAAPAAPTAPVAPVAPTETYVEPTVTESTGTVVTPEKKKPKPEPVYGSTSVSAALGPAQVPELKVPDRSDGPPVVPIGIAAFVAACCALAVWRLRHLRELPAAPSPRTARGPISAS